MAKQQTFTEADNSKVDNPKIREWATTHGAADGDIDWNGSATVLFPNRTDLSDADVAKRHRNISTVRITEDQEWQLRALNAHRCFRRSTHHSRFVFHVCAVCARALFADEVYSAKNATSFFGVCSKKRAKSDDTPAVDVEDDTLDDDALAPPQLFTIAELEAYLQKRNLFELRRQLDVRSSVFSGLSHGELCKLADDGMSVVNLAPEESVHGLQVSPPRTHFCGYSISFAHASVKAGKEDTAAVETPTLEWCKQNVLLKMCADCYGSITMKTPSLPAHAIANYNDTPVHYMQVCLNFGSSLVERVERGSETL